MSSVPAGGLRAFTLGAAARIESLTREVDAVIGAIRTDAETHREQELTSDAVSSPEAPERAQLLTELEGALTEYAGQLRQQCEELHEIMRRVAAQLGPDPAPEQPQRFEPGGPSEGLRLLAAQMAASGSTRGEIELRLRRDFKVSNVHELLNQIFAP